MKILILSIVILFLSACGSANKLPKRSDAHISKEKIVNVKNISNAKIPKIVASKPYVPVPKPSKKPETYTIVVNDVPAKELLFAIARDAKIDIDIIGDITGRISLNAIDNTLSQVLERISQHTGIKYQFKNNYLLIEKDSPFLKTYHVDYVNINRESTSKIDLATQISSAGSEQGNNSGGNNSSTTVTNKSKNEFWLTLENNINNIISLSGTQDKAGKNVIINKESGLISVYANSRQHKKIAEYIDVVISKVRRQVLIEATIIEVILNNEYQSGVDWSNLNNKALTLNGKLSDALGTVTVNLKALETFGDVQVLSSPKIIALNNQTAVLKVVDNSVYFTTSVDITPATTTTTKTEAFSSELHTVPIGFVMNVTPSISKDKEILLNVRPTISRILKFVNDPNPSLSQAGVISKIPEIQVREMESLLRMNDGQIAIIGGLMQDKTEQISSKVPVLSSIPVVGSIFGYEEENIQKTELIVFIKATIINNASVDNELKEFYNFIPTNSFETHLSPSER